MNKPTGKGQKGLFFKTFSAVHSQFAQLKPQQERLLFAVGSSIPFSEVATFQPLIFCTSTVQSGPPDEDANPALAMIPLASHHHHHEDCNHSFGCEETTNNSLQPNVHDHIDGSLLEMTETRQRRKQVKSACSKCVHSTLDIHVYSHSKL